MPADFQTNQSQSWSGLLRGYRRLFEDATHSYETAQTAKRGVYILVGAGVLLLGPAVLMWLRTQMVYTVEWERLTWFERPDIFAVLAGVLFAVAAFIHLRTFRQLNRSQDELHIAYYQLNSLAEAVSSVEEQLSVNVERDELLSVDPVEHLALRLELDGAEQLLRIWKNRMPELHSFEWIDNTVSRPATAKEVPE